MKNFLRKESGKFLPLSSILILFAALFASCSNDEEVTEAYDGQPDVVVTTMGKCMANTRALREVQADMPVLQFKDEVAYTAFLNKVKGMDAEEKASYFKNLDFDGAYQVLDKADQELDSIFDLDDRNEFEKALASYKSKYEGTLAFNTEDEYDVSPYLSFTDEDLAIVGNIKGYVVIDNKIVEPKLATPTFDLDNDTVSSAVLTRATTTPTPIQPGFKAFKNSSLTIKNGKYKSTMTIGRIVNGNSFCVEFVTKKKQFLWKKKVKASYIAVLEIKSSKFYNKNTVSCPSGSRWAILGLPIESVGTTFDATVTNFKSSKGSAIGSATFKGIRVI